MRQHGKDIRSGLLISVTAVTLSLMTTATSPEGAKREGSDTTQTQGCESRTRGDADVVCVQRRAQTECQRFTLPTLRDRCFSKPEIRKELSKRAKSSAVTIPASIPVYSELSCFMRLLSLRDVVNGFCSVSCS